MSFTEVFGGTAIYPSDVSYLPLALAADVDLSWPLESNASTNIAARIIDITPAAPGLSVSMPDARKAAPGQTTLFNNLGPHTVTIKSATGTTLISLAAGDLYQLYLVDNATEVGTWRNFEYGATTAQAQASSLAGNGLIAIGSTLAQASTVNSYSSSPVTLATADRASTFIWTGGLGTLNLPGAVTVGNNWFFNVRNSGSGNLTLDPAGADQINGGATLVLAPNDSAVVGCDGVSFYTVGLGQKAIFAFDYTSINLAGLSGNYTLSGSELNRIAYTFTGVITGNIVIIVPATVQQYWLDNATTGGSFTLSVKTVPQVTPLVVPRNERGIYYSDGSNVVKADTTAGVATPIAVLDGGTGATTASNARTNLGATGTGSSLFTTASPSAARATLGAGVIGDPLFTAATAAGARGTIGAAATAGDTITGNYTFTGGSRVILLNSFNNNSVDIVNTGATGTNNAELQFVMAPLGTVLSLTAAGLLTVPSIASSLAACTALPIVGGTTGTLSVARGGTGQTTANAALNALLPSQGGFAGRFLTTDGTNTSWAVVSGTGTVTGGSGGTTGLTLTGTVTLTLGGTLAVANGGTGGTTSTGSGAVVLATSPTLVTPNLGTPSAGTLTNTTGLPIIAGTTGTLTAARGGTGVTTSTGSGDNVLSASPALTGTPTSGGVEIGYRSVPRRTTTTTAVVGDRGGCIAASAGITIPNATFAASDSFSIYNDSAAAITITQGASLTLRQAGTTNTGNRTLAARGLATIWFNTASEAIIGGPGVS